MGTSLFARGRDEDRVVIGGLRTGMRVSFDGFTPNAPLCVKLRDDDESWLCDCNLRKDRLSGESGSLMEAGSFSGGRCVWLRDVRGLLGEAVIVVMTMQHLQRCSCESVEVHVYDEL